MCIGYTGRNSDVALSSWKNDKKWFFSGIDQTPQKY